MDFGKMRIVSIDDNEMELTILKSMLKKLGLNDIKLFSGPEDALEHITDNGADIVLTDYLMPRMDGVKLAKEIKKRWKNIPVIMITSQGDDQDLRKRARENGVLDILTKPLHSRQLKEAVESAFVVRISAGMAD
ncbi:MAG: response regulator [Alphaproteobacteria bacterium]|uniref:Response regulator n=1 Tax=Candidatus Nitrobium versatile TaxID=2884831 RepID=A0A953J7X1_9BACT|nr:response regulator [Candidatus Nitrobium versatile]